MDLRELEETARLAHLNTGADELAAALPAFEQMLGFFAAMSGAECAGTAAGRGADGAAAGAAFAGAGHFRDDSGAGGAEGTAGLGGLMVANAGERDGRFIVIPNVL